MFVELHILQNFAPSNLNRDESGAPKDCEFGGVRRARISSQCLKRAIRTSFDVQQLLPKDNLGKRSKYLVEALGGRLEKRGRPKEAARSVAESALRGMGLGVKDGKTEYLLFLGEGELNGAAAVCDKHWDSLLTAANDGGEPVVAVEQAAKRSAKEAKKAGKDALPTEVRKALEEVMDGGKAVDLALFGRMLADKPGRNVDAAAQVAHAISTNRVSMEFDFYTAVDELKPNETAGAGMLGTVEFNSACFYRYANVDCEQLAKNLGSDWDLARQGVEAFIRASVAAVPTGKQNSMAAQNRPSLVFAVLRRHGLCSLANAFVRPVAPDGEGDLVEKSIKALDTHWGQLAKMYGNDGIVDQWCATLDGNTLTELKPHLTAGVDALARSVANAPLAENNQGEAK